MKAIEANGLRAFNPKGISVLRTKEFDIINSIIALQLNAPEIVAENDFVLLKISQRLNNFSVFEIQPDIVFEWTWAVHNNIVRRTIPYENIEIESRFSVFNWDLISIDDFKNEEAFKQSDLYNNSFDFIYIENGRTFRLNNLGEKNLTN